MIGIYLYYLLMGLLIVFLLIGFLVVTCLRKQERVPDNFWFWIGLAGGAVLGVLVPAGFLLLLAIENYLK